jgi:hypothetical protein
MMSGTLRNKSSIRFKIAVKWRLNSARIHPKTTPNKLPEDMAITEIIKVRIAASPRNKKSDALKAVKNAIVGAAEVSIGALNI